MKTKPLFLFIVLLLSVAMMIGCAGTRQKIQIERLDDLPRHTYTIDVPVLELFENEDLLQDLMDEVNADLLADLEMYEISDATTLQGFYGDLGTIALLEERWDDYLEYLELRRELEDKEPTRLIMGMFTRAYITALRSGDDDLRAAFRREYEALVRALPYEDVEDELKQTKGQTDIFSENLILGIVESRIQPILEESGGEMSKDIATQIIGMNQTIRNYLPYTDIISEVLGAFIEENAVEKEDIWEEREVTLTESDNAQPVRIAVWDSGVDADIFGDRMYTNPNEIPGNGIDDDNNGYIDDVHGIAYDLHANKTTEMLYPIGEVSDRPRLQRLMKGLTDITSGVDSEEAAELRQTLSQMERSEVQPFIEDISKYGNYAHGTHVAGITSRGNPFIEIVISRLTFGHTMIPECPTIENALRDSIAMIETIDYFKSIGVRAVNMSWGGDLASIEADLEANNAGGTPEERAALARRIFEISRSALFTAIENAPEILFITSAGNSNNDVVFEEFYPSSFDLPNIMSVGAVDQAGDETDFTSFGKVDVYANGFEVPSYVPGGDTMNMSGTSMSSPNVTNLAAKLFAVNPDLTPAQVRALIEDACDDHAAGERSVRLINPVRSFELLEQRF